jgi:Glycosyl transferase family 2
MLTVAILAGTAGGVVDRTIASCLRHGVEDIAAFVTDRTTGPSPEIARHSAVRTLRLDWPDHFGAARNVALSRLDDRWVLFLDADEWLTEPVPASLVAGLDPTDVYAPRIREAGRSVEMLGIPRLVHTGADFSYARHVHEFCVRRLPGTASPVDVGPQLVDIRVGHDGYRPGRALDLKQQRNVRLGHLDLEEQPGDLRSMHFLVRDSFSTASFDWAATMLQLMSSPPTPSDYFANGYPAGWYVGKTFPLVVHIGLREGRVDEVLYMVREFAADAPSAADVTYYDLMVRTLLGETTRKDLESLMDLRASVDSTAPLSLAEDGRHLDAAIVHLLRIHHHESSARRYRATCQPWTDGFFLDSWARDDIMITAPD